MVSRQRQDIDTEYRETEGGREKERARAVRGWGWGLTKRPVGQVQLTKKKRRENMKKTPQELEVRVCDERRRRRRRRTTTNRPRKASKRNDRKRRHEDNMKNTRSVFSERPVPTTGKTHTHTRTHTERERQTIRQTDSTSLNYGTTNLPR